MIIYQKRIYREDLRRNPDVLYVFGDNVARIGLGGQAKEMRGEPNACGVATKWDPWICFTDTPPSNTTKPTEWIDEDLCRVHEHLRSGGVVVWPADGIGTGLACLRENAPKTWEHLQARLQELGVQQ